MKILIYVEGVSDRAGLSALLEPIMAASKQRRVGIQFLPLNSKVAILNDGPRKAAAHLSDNPGDWVVLLPDLYPMAEFDGTPNQHKSFTDLEQILVSRFRAHADRLGIKTSVRSRFRVHCLKYDLEALVLASVEPLRQRLGTRDALTSQWTLPVENQNDNRPPKRVVESLFARYRKRPGYTEATDAPWILQRASLAEVIAACPQHFAPFASELKAIAETGKLP
ncbi:MAG: DUF4276 family protein [Candidatus Sericytochromatia bacterium]